MSNGNINGGYSFVCNHRSLINLIFTATIIARQFLPWMKPDLWVFLLWEICWVSPMYVFQTSMWRNVISTPRIPRKGPKLHSMYTRQINALESRRAPSQGKWLSWRRGPTRLRNVAVYPSCDHRIEPRTPPRTHRRADDISSLGVSTVSSLWSLQHPAITEQQVMLNACVKNTAFGPESDVDTPPFHLHEK